MHGTSELTIEQLKRFFPEQWGDFIDECNSKLVDDQSLLESQWPEIKGMIIEQYGENDDCALDQAFNDWTDSLCRGGEISEHTYNHVTREEVE